MLRPLYGFMGEILCVSWSTHLCARCVSDALAICAYAVRCSPHATTHAFFRARDSRTTPLHCSKRLGRAGRLSVAIAIQHGLNITLKSPLLCVAWRVLPSVYKLDNRNVDASCNDLAHQE